MNLKLIIAQLNFLADDIEGNTQKVIDSIQIAEKEKQVDLIIFPELTLTYYPAQDRWSRTDIEERIQTAIQKIQALKSPISVILGYPKRIGNQLYNEAAVIQNGKIVITYQKQYLPNHNVFDEKRFFSRGPQKTALFELKNHRIALMICEDLWHPEPIQQAAQAGAECLISINASPFTCAKHEERAALLKERASTNQMPIVYVNWVGGQDDLIFDGGSFIVNTEGKITQQAPFFKELLWEVDLASQKPINAPIMSPVQRIYEALVLGTRDYVKKNQASKVLIGLSGGIDSALTLAIAVDALGKECVKAIMMPSRFTSQESLDYAERQAQLPGVDYEILSIEPMFTHFLNTLTNPDIGIVAENLQARCRGVLLMGISNQTGALILTTSNKSELAVGYTTLYGDMTGAFSVLKDVYKTKVYELAQYRNQISPAILPEIIQRPPSAELAPNQTDQDTLPPYEMLDQILYSYIEGNKSAKDIIQSGFNPNIVNEVIRRINLSEYKRKQAPIGAKVTSQAFGSDWRYPVSAKTHSAK